MQSTASAPVRAFARVAVVLVLLVAVFTQQTGVSHALNPGVAGPTLARGVLSRVAPGVFGPVGIAVGLGIAAWEGYQFAVDEGWFDNGEDGGEPSAVDSWSHTSTGWAVQVHHMGGDTYHWSGTGTVEDDGNEGLLRLQVQHGTTGNYTTLYESLTGFTDSVGAGFSFGFDVEAPTAPTRVRQESRYYGSWGKTSNYKNVTADGVQTIPPPSALPEATTQRTTTTSAQCVDETGATSTHTSTTDPYAADGSEIPAAPGVTCPPGTALAALTVTSDPLDGDGTQQELWHWEQDPDTLDPTKPYSECVFYDPGVASPCELELWRKLSPTDPETEYVKCDEFSGNCAEWWQHSQRDQLYECRWGDQVLDVEQCWELAPFYNPATPGQLAPNPELDPPSSPQLDPVITNPGTPTGSPTVPSTQTETGTGTGTTTLEPTDQPGADGCLSAGLVAWNPVTWVYAPVKCVLQWAFVPTTPIQTQLSTIGGYFDGRAPVSTIAALGTWADTWSEPGNRCLLLDVPIDLADVGAAHTQPVIDTCNPSTVETTIMGWRAFLSVVMYAALLGPLAWWAWRQYAPGSQGLA